MKCLSSVISLLLCAAIAAGGAVLSASALDRGDIDGDGFVNATDARLALRYAAKLEEGSAEQLAAADVDGSGEVDAVDARYILRFAAKLEELPELPDIPSRDPIVDMEGVDASEADVRSRAVCYYSIVMTDANGDTPLEYASDGVNSYVRTRLVFGNRSNPVDAAVIQKNSGAVFEQGLYIINNNTGKYMFLDKSALALVGDEADVSALIAAPNAGVVEVANVDALSPYTDASGNKYVRLNNADGSFTGCVFNESAGNFPIVVRHYDQNGSMTDYFVLKEIVTSPDDVARKFAPPSDYTRVSVSDRTAAEQFMAGFGILLQ